MKSIFARYEIDLRLPHGEDIQFMMATERLPGYEKFIGQWTEAAHRQAMATAGTVYLIASRPAERPEGFAIIRDIDDADENVFIKRVAVRNPGTGFGTRFMRALVDWTFENTKVHRLWLDAIEDNQRARHLYGKLGFSEEGLIRESFIRADGTRASLVFMSLLRWEWAWAPKDR
jgi:RimJ/RimL family protein N-acetyltransferase